MGKTAIKVKNVWKRFKLYNDVIIDPVKEHIFFWKRKHYFKEFWVIKDISFEVPKGEILGIIGPNGAGKTTLLKMIAGLLEVDKGKIEVNGKVTALLRLGIGFHPEMTGRENILYGGMLLGMSKEEVLEKMENIIEFSELGDYIDRPFRTYSSGMQARLIFATSMSIDPNILIIDEALATGDVSFVQKSSKRIREICESGATILFVSHNLLQIQDICQRVLFIAEGRIMNEGKPERMIEAYYKWYIDNKSKQIYEEGKNNKKTYQMISGTGEIILKNVTLKNGKGEITNTFITGEPLLIELEIDMIRKVDSYNLFIGFLFNNKYIGHIVTHDLILKGKLTSIQLKNKNNIKIYIKNLLLLTGEYTLWIWFYSSDRKKFITYSQYRNLAKFFVAQKSNPIKKSAYYTQPVENII